MRSHPYEPPLSLPPLLDDLADELSSMLPNQQYYHSRRRSSTSDIPLSELDPDTSRLLAPAPTRRRQHHHHVRVQGRLALVRSVSSANLHSPVNPGGSTSPGSAVPPVPRFDLAVGSTVKLRKAGNSKGRTQGRRLSLDDGGVRDRPDSDTETDGERQRETVVRDRQLRGYGIGGAGNIRRFQCPSVPIGRLLLE